MPLLRPKIDKVFAATLLTYAKLFMGCTTSRNGRVFMWQPGQPVEAAAGPEIRVNAPLCGSILYPEIVSCMWSPT
jgi:hypothetical protein